MPCHSLISHPSKYTLSFSGGFINGGEEDWFTQVSLFFDCSSILIPHFFRHFHLLVKEAMKVVDMVVESIAVVVEEVETEAVGAMKVVVATRAVEMG